MKTVGKVLKEARLRKKYSRVKLEKETKIKKEFIKAIEEEDWDSLPEYPVVAGFVRSMSRVLKVDRKQAAARLRRDYPPKSLRINPKPDVSSKFVWSPRLTFLLGVLVVSAIIVGYLGFQYIGFISPPPLTIESPNDGDIVHERLIQVSGKTDPDAVVKVNNQPVLVEEDGSFVAQIKLYQGTHFIEVKAISRSGKESTVMRKIIPELESTRM